MNRRIRAHHRPISRADPYLKYLKPGALAQLRDARISARSHRVNSLSQISLRRPTPPPSPLADSQVVLGDAPPCFSGRTYGPRCPQRKKLVAAKPFSFLGLGPDGSDPASPDSVIDAFGGDAIAAH